MGPETSLFVYETWLIYSAVLVSGIQQSASVIRAHAFFVICFSLWFLTRYCMEFPGLYSRSLLFILYLADL